MSVAQRRRDLISAIADEYSEFMKVTSDPEINTTVVVVSAVTVECTNTQCKTCLLTRFTENALTEPEYTRNLGLINEVRNGVCAGVCACNNQAVINNTIIFKSNAVITELSPQDADKVAARVIAKLDIQYPNGNFPLKISDLLPVLEGNTEITTSISQLLSSVQILTLNGPGKVKRVRMEAMTDAIFNAVATYSASVIQDTVASSIDQIKRFVNEQAEESIGSAFAATLKYWIWMGIVLAGIVVAYLVLLVIKATRRRRAKI
jgi:hypothetical protein